MSESIPSSTTGFAHRRARADSTASFTYFQENEESSESSHWPDDEAIEDPSDEEEEYTKSKDGDLETGLASPKRRISSGFSRLSVEDPLLLRHNSARTDASGLGRAGRHNQKIYIVTEDLTVIFAGFSTSAFGMLAYIILCLTSFGIGYLIFRWLPCWKVRLVGSPKPLRECSWIVIEV